VIKLNGKALLIAAMLCSAIGFASCSSTPTTNTGNVVVTNKNKPANTAPANTTKTETVATGDKTGVPECDEYIEKYEACLTSIGEKYPQVQPSLKSAFEAQRKGFKDAAASPSGKETLPGVCKQAIESAKESTKAYACKW
jgi:hypothetical protein